MIHYFPNLRYSRHVIDTLVLENDVLFQVYSHYDQGRQGETKTDLIIMIYKGYQISHFDYLGHSSVKIRIS